MRWLALVLSLCTLTASRAEACASCGAGDPTLTLAGTEQPFAGRVRVSISAASSGTTAEDEHVADRRFALGLAWAPVSSVMLSASAPFVLRSLSTTGGTTVDGTAPGDLDLRARIVVLRDRAIAPTHLITLQVGARFPLAPVLTDAHGIALDDGAQTASPTLTPLGGIAWSIYAAPFSLQTYALVTIPTRGSDGLARPIEVRAASLAIVQCVPALSLIAGPEARARIDGAGSEGGGVLFATLGAMFGIGDVTPYLLARVPLVGSFGDGHTELLSLELGAAVDL